jgi:hypothetical protein
MVVTSEKLRTLHFGMEVGRQLASDACSRVRIPLVFREVRSKMESLPHKVAGHARTVKRRQGTAAGAQGLPSQPVQSFLLRGATTG